MSFHRPSSPRNLKLTVEYDGTDFKGWQIQPGERTVQGTLVNAIADLTGQTVQLAGASRTDRGVHASGQVARIQARSLYTEAISRW